MILDSGSTLHVFCSPSLVDNIREADSTVELNTNGPLICTQQADVPGLGTVWFNKDAMANIIGMGALEKTHDVFYSTKEGPTYLVTNRATGKESYFLKNARGLYVHHDPDATPGCFSCLLYTSPSPRDA